MSVQYERRWHEKLDFRNIKTTLGMEVLRCLIPQMVEKEPWVNLLGCNLIRLLMAQAALEAGLHPRELLSWKPQRGPSTKTNSADRLRHPPYDM